MAGHFIIDAWRKAVAVVGLVCCVGGFGVIASEAQAAPDACSNADFRHGIASRLPDCRAYEQVSPANKNGFDIESRGEFTGDKTGGVTGRGSRGSYAGATPIARGGEAATFESGGSFADSAFGGVGSGVYVARRGETDWMTHALVPPMFPALRPNDPFAFDSDLRQALHFATAPITDEPIAGSAVYSRDMAGSSFDLLVTTPTAWGLLNAVIGAPENPSHFYFVDREIHGVEPDLPAPPVDKIYEYDKGTVRLASRQPNGEPFGTATVLGSMSNSVTSTRRSKDGAVSSGGRYAFFSAPGTGAVREIYRSDGGTTMLVSPSKLDPPAPTAAKTFVAATDDGNRVFFTTSQRLTEDANSSGEDLYRYDIATDELVNLSAGTDAGTAAGVQGVAGFSPEGDRVYFVATGQVVPNEGVTGERNLFLWEDDGSATGVVRFIVVLNSQSLTTGGDVPSDHLNWHSDTRFKTAQVAPKGGELVFQSRAPLKAGFNNSQDSGSTRCSGTLGISGAPCSQVYRYDPGADGGAGELACLSCRSDGQLPLDHTYVPTVGLPGLAPPRMVSDDGDRVVFASRDPIVPSDSNGRYDAYLWQAQGNGDCELEGGCLSLLSTGTVADDAYPAGLSATGDDAFFRTLDRLVPQDGDTLSDLYTARVGGGLPIQQRPAPPSCDGDSCQGQSVPPPRGPAMGTDAFDGSGDARPEKRPSKPRVTRKKVQVGNRIRLRIRVDRAGLLTVSGSGLRTVHRFVRRKGTYRVSAALAKRARRTLARRGRRAMKVKVTFRATTGGRPVSRTVRVTLRSRAAGGRQS